MEEKIPKILRDISTRMFVNALVENVGISVDEAIAFLSLYRISRNLTNGMPRLR